MVRLITATRHKVVTLHQQGHSQTKISKETGVSRCSVQALMKKHKEMGNGQLDSGTIMTVCEQQWSMVEVPCKFGAAFQQMELEIWSGLMVSSILRNTGRYLSIMQIPSGRHMIGPKCILQQDNYPKHTANVIKNYLHRREEQEVLEVMVWPHRALISASSSVSDLRKPTSTEDQWLVLQDVWNNLPAELLQKLCASVPRRIDAVLKAKSGHTKCWFDLDFSSVRSLNFVNWWK